MKRAVLIVMALTFLFSSVAFAAESPQLKSISGATVTQVNKSGMYTGKTHEVKVKVTLDGKTLMAGTDYVIVGNFTTSGDGGKYNMTATVYGIGKYTGKLTKKLSYTIKRYDQKVTGTKTYTVSRGKSLKPDLKAHTKLVYSCSAKGIEVSNGRITVAKSCKPGIYKVQVYARISRKWNKSPTITLTIKVE